MKKVKKTLDEWASEIRTASIVANKSNLQLAKIVAASVAEHDGEKSLVALAQKSQTELHKFKKLCSIGACTWLMNHEPDQLPLGYSVLHQLSLIPAELSSRAVQEGIVSPAVSRSEVEEWRNQNALKASKTGPDESDMFSDGTEGPDDEDAEDDEPSDVAGAATSTTKTKAPRLTFSPNVLAPRSADLKLGGSAGVTMIGVAFRDDDDKKRDVQEELLATLRGVFRKHRIELHESGEDD